MRQLFLHAGLPKTGTTYLQTLFLRNRAALEAAGLGFGPHMDPVTGPHLPGFVAALEARGAAAVIAETEACLGEKILVSNEDLAHFLPMPAGDGRTRGEALRDAAAGRFAVTVIVYVRRQDFLKESIFAQSVKAWYCGDIRDLGHYDFDLDGKLRALEAIFGRDRVRAVVYDDLRRGDIVAPLLAALGLDIDPARLAPVGRENASMHRRKLLFLGGFPKPAAAGHARNAPARALAGFVARVLAGSDAVADDGGRFLMSPAERHALVAAPLAGNRALVARHGIADPGGFVELPDPEAPWTPPAPITAREVAAVWREALAAARASRDPLRAAWLAARLARPFAAMAARSGLLAPRSRRASRAVAG
jgi:hypothetical protein